MNIHLTTRNLTSSQALIDHARHRAAFALARFDTLVRDLELRLCDINGPRGGPGIACLARLRLARGGEVVVESSACSPEEGIALSLARLANRLRRVVSRHQDHR